MAFSVYHIYVFCDYKLLKCYSSHGQFALWHCVIFFLLAWIYVKACLAALQSTPFHMGW